MTGLHTNRRRDNAKYERLVCRRAAQREKYFPALNLVAGPMGTLLALFPGSILHFAPRLNATMSEDGLPAAHVKRLVKSKLAELMSGLGPDAKGNTHEGHVQKEALNAFGESAKIFIHYLTATANEFCREGKRQTIGVDDVFRAIEDLEFGEFTEPLKQALEGA